MPLLRCQPHLCSNMGGIALYLRGVHFTGGRKGMCFMARKSVLTALVLPLPFAALPLLSLVVGHFSGGSGGLVVTEPVPVQRQLDQLQQDDTSRLAGHSLSYGITDPSRSGCEVGSTSTIDG